MTVTCLVKLISKQLGRAVRDFIMLFDYIKQVVDHPKQKAKWLKTCLSIPAESKIAEKRLSPPMRVANKLTPKINCKMAEKTPEHPGREQNS